MEQSNKTTFSPGADETETLATLMLRQSRAYPDRAAFVFLDNNLDIEHSLSFAALAETSDQIGQALMQHASSGEPVLLAYNNCMDAIQAFWACIMAGLIPVPAPAPESSQSQSALSRLAGIIADADIKLALTTTQHIDTAANSALPVKWTTVSALLDEPTHDDTPDSLSPSMDPGSLAYLQYTSGSTSAPRGVEITHSALIAQAKALDNIGEIDMENDRSLIWLPWFHDYGLVHAVILPVRIGFTSYIMPTMSFMRQPLRWLDAVAKYRVTHTGAPNFAFAACVQALNRKHDWTASLNSLRVFSCGAEPVRRDTLDEFIEAFTPHGLAPQSIAPSYGLAEAVLVVSLSREGLQSFHFDATALEQDSAIIADPADPSATELVSCGSPLPGFTVQIVEPENCRLLRENQVGEIWVLGPSLGRGYLKNSTATHETFNGRLADKPESAYLRTGDLGFLHNGKLFVTGRRKDMLVVNGRNIYPQDLEKCAEQAHDSVRPAGVIAGSIMRNNGQESVVLLLECRGRPTPDKVANIIETIRQSVAADFEVDVHEVVPLRSASLPRTSSGKPQRSYALKNYRNGELEERRLEAAADTTAEQEIPEEIMQRVLTIWGHVLGVENLSADADFFALGGDSLLATQIISRLNAHFGIEIPVRTVFEAPSPSALARRVIAAEPVTGESATAAKATPAKPGDKQELSFTQERMWFMHQLAPESAAYNVPLAMRIRGKLNFSALQNAVNIVINRHQILQTVFVATAEGPHAELVSTQSVEISEVDLRSIKGPRDSLLSETLTRLSSEAFRLEKAPLMRMTLVRVTDEKAVMLWVMHHIISDQWSCVVLLRELAAAYRQQLEPGAPKLPELTLQYADFAAWQRQWFSGERFEQQLSYWRSQLDGIEPLQLNEDYPRGTQQNFVGGSVRRELSSKRLAALQSFTAQHGASLSMVFIAALKVLLFRHTGHTDIAIGVPVANRHQLSSEDLIGSFVNTLVFRTDLAGEPNFDEALRRVKEVSLQAYSHQDLPFELLVRELDLPHDISRSPLFDVMFNMINTPAQDIEFPGLEWSRLDFDRGAAQFDLMVSVDALYDPTIVFEYASGLYSTETMERLADHYLRILDAVVADSSTLIGNIRLLSDKDITLMRKWGEGRSIDGLQQRSVSELVTMQAEERPSSIAVICSDQQRTYAELNANANYIAQAIRRRGLGLNGIVGLCLPRTATLPEVLLGTMRSGAAYVPLDPAYPRERLLHQAQDADIDLLIADEQTAHYLGWPVESTMLVDSSADYLDSTAAPNATLGLSHEAGREDPAYLIYTSGSTGIPKGVVVPHRALENFIDTMRREPGIDADDRVLAVTTLGFDIAVLEILVPLAAGACTVIANETQASDGTALVTLLDKHDITLMQATPSRWQMLLTAGWQGKPNLRALVGGEPLPPNMASQLLERCRELWNMYGPTETTVWSSCWRVPPTLITPISLGNPVTATTLQVLDEKGQLCPVGVPGELCIGGRGLTLGYHLKPELTAKQFVTAGAHTAFPGAAIYRTGDRARWRRDGRLEHLGRFDNQLKLRGYRIEAGEIESHLLRHTTVERALVSVHQDPLHDPQLVAYIVSGDADAKADDWRLHLRQWLPEYMVPRHFITLTQIPVLPNGKVNRRALPVPDINDSLESGADRPESAPEHALLQIWRAVLQREDVGAHDNFFDLGGHSLLAVSLVQAVTQDLAIDCTLPMLFQYPTVASLTAALQKNNTELQNSAAAYLLKAGTGRPLFCLSGMDMYQELAEHFPAETRVYGLLSVEELELFKSGQPLPPLRDMAMAYLKVIRRLQPHGPYRLTGFSIGGMIAFEVACRLRDAGEQVECLALLDSAVPGFGLGNVSRLIQRRLIQLRRDALGYLRRAAVDIKDKSQNVGKKRTPPVYREFLRVMRAHDPEPWEGPLLFCQAEGDPIKEPGYGWQAHAPELNVVWIPGEHMDMLSGASAKQVALHLQSQFDNVSAGSPDESP